MLNHENGPRALEALKVFMATSERDDFMHRLTLRPWLATPDWTPLPHDMQTH